MISRIRVSPSARTPDAEKGAARMPSISISTASKSVPGRSPIPLSLQRQRADSA